MSTRDEGHVHDLVGIGIGPFNLGLACLADPLPLDAVFLDAADGFDWHPGMMLEDATVQVPFLADLVTMADPTSRFSFLAHLKETGRLYSFYIRESFYPLRREYADYCRWAASMLDSLRWGHRVTRVEHDGAAYVVTAETAADTRRVRGRHLVLGVGTVPSVPDAVAGLDGPVLHSSDYLHRRDDLRRSRSITVVGSGQSAAEIYLDLLEGIHDGGYHLTWLTRSPRFFPMEYTKLTLEMTSPEWVDHFHALPAEQRDRQNRAQRHLHKGISGELVDAIYDTLYRKRSVAPVPTTLATSTALTGARWDGSAYRLDLRHEELGTEFGLETEGLVLATGYRAHVPGFLEPVRDRLRFDARGRYDVARDFTIDLADREVFVQNAEEHTHGLTAPDLGMGAHRNSRILAQVLGREVYPVERRIAFQEFGVPSGALVAEEAAR
ncbi:SidA/IucD/PvdA family monooxygenase [Nocardioides flavescens]|uniref:L-lysine N6-monooxygenase MbtG n=1 Tax=Nocardioides flavescens TaxID=2691959 RepID=A0A6L7EZK0_9ACTN|nr:SidA/IucD/PvdA family monooxygenase [Nocardioides flavescens]